MHGVEATCQMLHYAEELSRLTVVKNVPRKAGYVEVVSSTSSFILSLVSYQIFNIVSTGMYASTRVRAQVFSLESGICQKCGLDANGEFSALIL